MAEALRPDVILMDLRMPGLGGAAAIRELGERGLPARVLVLTTYDSDSDVVPALEAGATGYLLKDSPREELVRAIRAAARGEAVLAPSVATRLVSQLRAPAPDALERAGARGPAPDRPGRDEPRRGGPACSSPRRPSRRTCSTSTRSSTSTTAPRRSPPPTNEGCWHPATARPRSVERDQVGCRLNRGSCGAWPRCRLD